MLVLVAAVAPAPPDVEIAFTPIPAVPAVFVELEELPDDVVEPLPPRPPRHRARDAGAVAAGVTFAAVTGVLVTGVLSPRAPVPVSSMDCPRHGPSCF